MSNINIFDNDEIKEKEARVRDYLEKNGYAAMLLGRQDNFAWFSGGGSSRVVVPTEYGFSILVITLKGKYLVSQVMDGKRVVEEELAGMDIEYVPLHWYEQSREEKALELVRGMRVVSDMPLPGVDYRPKEIYRLHYPLIDSEITKLRWLGEKSEEILYETALSISPGMTEHEVEAILLYEYARHDIQCDVLLVGSDERIYSYRHPNPSPKRIGRYILLHPAVKKWGLHANVTRLLYFGDVLPEGLADRYEAACTIAAAAMAMCEEGTPFADILEEQKRLYKELGYADEWRNHYQGGITGYMVADPTLCFDSANKVQNRQAFDWFITITGVKVEELGLFDGMQEFISVTGRWPCKTYGYNGKKLNLPEILIR